MKLSLVAACLIISGCAVETTEPEYYDSSAGEPLTVHACAKLTGVTKRLHIKESTEESVRNEIPLAMDEWACAAGFSWALGGPESEFTIETGDIRSELAGWSEWFHEGNNVTHGRMIIAPDVDPLDVARVVRHEMGHALLGLGHAPGQGCVMTEPSYYTVFHVTECDRMMVQ